MVVVKKPPFPRFPHAPVHLNVICNNNTARFSLVSMLVGPREEPLHGLETFTFLQGNA